MVVDDGRQVHRHVVFGHADLLGHLDDLDLDVDLEQALRQGVDLDQARVDGLIELAELGDQTDVALVDLLVGVGEADTAGNGAQGSDAGTESVD